jgi:NitT/TauT family transport system permease protein
MPDGVNPERDANRWPIGVRLLLGAVPFLLVAIVWMVLVHVVRVSPIFLPPLEDLPRVVSQMFLEENIHEHIGLSILRVGGGLLAAFALATPLGIAMGWSVRVRHLTEPFVAFMRYLPMPVFIPLCILWFGSGDLEKIVVILLGAFFQLTLMVRDAAINVRPEYYEAATMLGAPRRDLILRVLWPAALPRIFDSYRICIGWAWTYLLVAEMVGATTGIGYYIITRQRYLMVPQIFAAMVMIGVLGMVTDIGLAALHARLFPWEDKESASQPR